MNAITTYLNEAIQELHKVRWPTRQQAIRLSLIVISFTAVAAVILGLVDSLLSQLIQILVSS